MKNSSPRAPMPNQTVVKVEQDDRGRTVLLDATGHASHPICGTHSQSRHSSHLRSLQDFPARGTPVTVRARVTRRRCRSERCERRTLAKRAPELAAPFARRTIRMAGIVRLFGHGAGGRPSERLLNRLGMPAGHTTILRHLKRSAGELGPGIRRVQRWVRLIELPERNIMAPKPSTPAYHGACLARRWAEGSTKVKWLFAEIRQRGRTGSFSHLARFLAPWRKPARDAMSAQPCLFPDEIEAVPSSVPAIDPMTGREISPVTAAPYA